MTTARKTHWLRNTLIVLVILGIIGTVLAVFLYKQDAGRVSASASIQLSFNGAANGEAPNGNAYNIQEAASAEVLEAAIAKAGLSDKYTAEQLKDSVVVRGVYPEDIVNEVLSFDSLLDFTANRELTITEYFPTEFSVTLYHDFDTGISEKDLRALAKGIAEAYRETFIRKYSLAWDVQQELAGFDALDYNQQLTVMNQNLQQAYDFTAKLYEKEPSFRANGMGFDDIMARLTNMTVNEIPRMEAGVVQNALSKNEGRLLTQYRYQIENQVTQILFMRVEMQRLDEMIAAYEKGEIIYLSTADALNQVGGSGSATYDTLVQRRNGITTEITRLNTEIARVQKRVEELVSTGAVSKADADAALAPIASLTETAEAPAETVKEPVKETVTVPAVVAEEPAGTGTEEEAAPAAEPVQAQAAETAAETETIGLTDEEKQELRARQIATLQDRMSKLSQKAAEILTDLNTLLKAYNEQEMTEDTIRLLSVKYNAPKLLSGAFVMKAIKTAGPLCAVGFIICLILLIRDRRKESKVQ